MTLSEDAQRELLDIERGGGLPGQGDLAKGFGVRQVGKPETVDADTVFQLASLSKPIASTGGRGGRR